jgi:hypothetical protein
MYADFLYYCIVKKKSCKMTGFDSNTDGRTSWNGFAVLVGKSKKNAVYKTIDFS